MEGVISCDECRTPTQNLEVRWLSRLSEMEELRRAWLELMDRVPAPRAYSHPDWVLAWYECYASEDGSYQDYPFLGTVSSHDSLYGIAPFLSLRSQSAKLPVRSLILAGFNMLTGEFLLDTPREVVLAALFRSLANRQDWDVLNISCLPTSGDLVELIPRLLHAEGLDYEITDYEPYALVDLSQGYDHYLAEQGGRFRRNVRRWGRKIRDAGGWTTDRLGPSPPSHEVEQFLERIWVLVKRGWRVKERSLDDEERHNRFYRKMVRTPSLHELIDLQILKVGGSDAAYCLGLVRNNRYFHLLQGFDDDLRSLSPGAFHLQKIFERLASQGVHTVISDGGYAYKRHWASSFVPQSQILVFNRTLRGRLSAFLKLKVKPQLARIPT